MNRVIRSRRRPKRPSDLDRSIASSADVGGTQGAGTFGLFVYGAALINSFLGSRDRQRAPGYETP